jgi:hypothetical protein
VAAGAAPGAVTLGWLDIVAGAAVFVAALAVPLDGPALVVALMLAARGGRPAPRYHPLDARDAGRCNLGAARTEYRRRSTVNTVLVVDDKPYARYSMAHPLTRVGFDVRETATGRDALRLAAVRGVLGDSASSGAPSKP